MCIFTRLHLLTAAPLSVNKSSIAVSMQYLSHRPASQNYVVPGTRCVYTRSVLQHLVHYLKVCFKYVSCEFGQFQGRYSSLQELRDTPVARVA